MSAWPQAVWIINKLQQKDNLVNIISSYENNFTLLQQRLKRDEDSVDQIINTIQNTGKSGGIVVEPLTWDSDMATDGTFWFVSEQYNNFIPVPQQDENEDEDNLLDYNDDNGDG